MHIDGAFSEDILHISKYDLNIELEGKGEEYLSLKLDIWHPL